MIPSFDLLLRYGCTFHSRPLKTEARCWGTVIVFREFTGTECRLRPAQEFDRGCSRTQDDLRWDRCGSD